ncbi:leucyl aminopeptidase, partial [filamentous cyanobacterium CCP5]
MEFQASAKSPLSWTGDCLIVGICEADLPLSRSLSELDSRVSGLLQELVEDHDFTGKAGTSAAIRVGRDGAVRKLGIVGLGAKDKLDLEGLRQAAAAAAKLAKKERCTGLGLSFPQVKDAAQSAQALTEGILLA